MASKSNLAEPIISIYVEFSSQSNLVKSNFLTTAAIFFYLLTKISLILKETKSES